jgi:Serine dehydrogenase proteinase
MSLMRDYIKNGVNPQELETELLELIKLYNEKQDTYLFVYASAVSKSSVPDTSLGMEDYFTIFDLLRGIKKPRLDFYIETPGGSGEAVEEIVKFLRKNFNYINYVISGEAKSAGTILALSGDKISMTQSGSMGPIDAQVPIGRSMISAYDYIEWVNEKRELVDNGKVLSDFDLYMIAQISPGELKKVQNGLDFAKKLVIGWLADFKFKDWDKTETNGNIVDRELKLTRAEEIADELVNHGKWRTHKRSLKIEDLEDLKLKITKIDEDPDLADIVYRIQTVIKILFFTNSYKIFATADEKLFRTVIPIPTPIPSSQKNLSDESVCTFMDKCSKCGKIHEMYAKFTVNPDKEDELKSKGVKPLPVEDKLLCECGSEIDLSQIKNEIERSVCKKIVYDKRL